MRKLGTKLRNNAILVGFSFINLIGCVITICTLGIISVFPAERDTILGYMTDPDFD